MMDKAESPDPESLARHAAMLERSGRMDAAVDAWTEALRTHPRRGDWAHRAGLGLIKLSRPREAVTMLRRAVALMPREAVVMHDLAGALFWDARFDEAVRCYERAAELAPKNPIHLVHLATARERMRDVAGARAAVDRALAIDPEFGPALVVLAELLMHEGKPAEALASAERGMGQTNRRRMISRAQRVRGRALDRLGRSEDAFAAHMRANDLTLEDLNGPAILKIPIENRMRRLRREGLAERFAAWEQRAPTNTPDPVFLCGFPRSGTTLMENILGALPGVSTNDEQAHSSIVFRAMDRDDPGSSDRDLADTLDALPEERVRAYRALFWEEIVRRIPGWRDGAGIVAVDKQPLRLMDIPLVQRLFPRARLLVMVRDPRDVCLSALFQDFEPNPFMARFLDVEATGKFHAEIMAFWLEMRPIITMPWIEVQYRHLVKNFETQTKRTADFLHVAWSEEVHRFSNRASTRSVSSASFDSVTHGLSQASVGRWRRFADQLAPILDDIQPIVDAYGFDPE